MPQTEFAPAFRAVLAHEGGWSDHPRDPGGATMKGVTQRVYDGFRQRQGQPLRSVALIEGGELQAIYRRQYWDVIRGDDLPAGVAYVVFDGAVNSGPAQSVRWLQRALGMNQVDGIVGEATLAMVRSHSDHDRLIADMLAKRMAFLKRLKTWSDFGRGWSARVAEVKERGQAWAAGSVGPVPAPVAGGEAKARREDATRAPTTSIGDAGIGAGVGGNSAAVILKDAQAQLEPIAGGSSTVATIVAVLAITSTAILLGGFVVRLVQDWRAKRHAEALA